MNFVPSFFLCPSVNLRGCFAPPKLSFRSSHLPSVYAEFRTAEGLIAHFFCGIFLLYDK
jgi:hypothetical protein